MPGSSLDRRAAPACSCDSIIEYISDWSACIPSGFVPDSAGMTLDQPLPNQGGVYSIGRLLYMSKFDRRSFGR